MSERSPSRLVHLLFSAAICWLVASGVPGIVAGIKLVWPGFLDGAAWLTYGRVAPAAVNVLVYGWISSAAFGSAFWLLERLGRPGLKEPAWVVTAAAFWQVGVMMGVAGILGGQGRSIFLLDFPASAAVMLFLSGTCLSVWGCLLLCSRTQQSLYASSWYFLAALLSFPWLYVSGTALLIWFPIPGPAQIPVGAWFAGGLGALWIAAGALAVLYFLIPQELGRRLASYHLAPLAFWSFTGLGAWAGLSRVIGGAVPAWMSGTGSFFGLLMLVPVLIIGLNLLGTMKGAGEAIRSSLVLHFALFSSGAFLLASLQGVFLALPAVNGFFQFTDVVLGQGVLFLLGFVTPAWIGGMLFERGRGGDADRGAMRWVFWMMAGSVVVMSASLSLGGLLQALAQSDPGFPFMTSVTFVRPFRFVACLGLMVYLAGVARFAVWYFCEVYCSKEPRS